MLLPSLKEKASTVNLNIRKQRRVIFSPRDIARYLLIHKRRAHEIRKKYKIKKYQRVERTK